MKSFLYYSRKKIGFESFSAKLDQLCIVIVYSSKTIIRTYKNLFTFNHLPERLDIRVFELNETRKLELMNENSNLNL